MKYIIKISPEITIKSKPVRKRCILMLKNNITKHLRFNDIKAHITWNWDRLELEWEDKKIPKILKQIPWIANFMEVEWFLLPENSEEIFDFVFKKTKDYYLDKIENKTFVVRVKRVWNHDFKSLDLERYIWWWLLKYSTNSKVQLKNPEITVKIDIKDKKIFIVKNTEFWLWGYPVWFQDRVLSLISGWFDSWVSTYSMMKRWCEVDYLFFNLWWKAHEMWVKQASFYLWKNFSIPHKRARFICVDFEEIIKELLTKVNHRFRWILLKRYMLKVASMISKNHYYAIIKWDSLGQVSSQTLKNMHVIDKASDELVLRPLIWFNKQEIVDISKQIWTYNYACNMPEYCWVISDKPATWAKLEQILEEEENISEEVLVRAFETRKTELVNEMMEKYNWQEKIDIEVVLLPWKDEIVIDIREDLEKNIAPLKLEKTEIIEIPFFEINNKFEFLDQSKTYLLYCERWVLSNLHWLYLKEKWFFNIKIIRLIKNDKACSVK